MNQGPKSPVGECPAKNGPVPTYLLDSKDCHLFYECESGEAIPKECLPELCFDPVLHVCAFPEGKRDSAEWRKLSGKQVNVRVRKGALDK